MDAKTLNKIIHELDENLAKLEAEPQNLLIYYESAAGLCWLALNEMRKLVIKNGFQNQQAEIQFFKHIKPKVFSKYIYYYKLFEIESYRHNASKKFQIKYLNQVLKNMHRYLEENMQFCQYHWGNKKYMDHLYFVYKHRDLERVHFHVVSTRIDRQTGRKIKDNYEKQKMQKFVQELEQKYDLTNKQQKEIPNFKFSPRSRNIKQNLENLFTHLNRMPEITSKEMYNEALKLFHVEIKKSGRGHIVLITDGEGNPIRYPIRLSKFKEQPGFYQKVEENVQLEKEFNKSQNPTQNDSIQLSKSFVRNLMKLIPENNTDRDFNKQRLKKRKKGKQNRF